jgi:hypothetical protein
MDKYYFYFLFIFQPLATIWVLYGYFDLENKPSIFTWTEYDGLFLFTCSTIVFWGIGFIWAWIMDRQEAQK